MSSTPTARDITMSLSVSLRGLRPSKRLIDDLTMYAEMNIESAEVIVNLIKEFSYDIDYEKQLPMLYLIDSIVKSLREPYRDLFEPFLSQIFLRAVVLSKDDERLEQLKELRKTWDTVFSEWVLAIIDHVMPKVEVENMRYRMQLDGIHDEMMALKIETDYLCGQTKELARAHFKRFNPTGFPTNVQERGMKRKRTGMDDEQKLKAPRKRLPGMDELMMI